MELTRRDFEQLSAYGTRVKRARGDTLFRRGDVERSMYLLVEGEVRLEFPGGKEAKTVGPGSVFGELAFLMGEHARSATAIAATDCQLVVADQPMIERLLDEQPRLLFTVLRHVCSYLFGSEQSLIADLQARNEELRLTIDYLRRTREELSYQELVAQTDALTGLYNRRCLDEQLPKAMERARMTQGPMALVLLDLDGFKAVNDTLGHPAGDDVLRRMARILAACTRKSDLPCRLGGDEFALLLPDVGESRAVAIAESVRAAAAGEFARERGLGTPVSCSLGLAAPRPDESAAELLGRADQALYEAKRLGKDRVVSAPSLVAR